MSRSDNDSFYSSKLFQDFFKNSQRSLVLKADAPHFTIIAVSDTYLALTHKQREQLLGKGLFEVYPGSQSDLSEKNSVHSSFMRAIHTKATDELPIFKYEIYVAETDSYITEYWTNVNEPLLDEEGNVGYIINTTTNITQQILTVQHAEQAERNLRLATEAARMGTWYINPDTKDLQYNAMLAEIFGYEAEEKMTYDQAIGQVTDEYLPLIKAAIEKAIANGGNYEFTYQQRRFNDGKLIWLRSLGKITADEKGEHTLFSGVVIDITPQMEAQKAVTESEERFRTMADNSGILIGVGNETGEVTYFNNAWLKLTGKTMKDLLAFGWSGLIHPDDREAYINLYMDSLKKRVPYTGEYRILSAGGEYRWLLAFASPRFNSDNSFAGYIGSFIDITERKQDEQRKNDFINMVSHELKTPLTSTISYVQVTQARAKKHDDVLTAGMMDRAGKQLEKMTRMINGFLNVSRLESGKIYIDRQRFDMALLIKETEEESIASITTHQVVFAPVHETWVDADRDKIGQVINNLLSNAVKYSPPKSTINVACVTVNGKVQVSVSDEGMGISKDELPRLFERYYRVKEGENKNVAGFGIGLYLCCEIIKRHNGDIWAESELGKGSTFRFSLPILTADKLA